LALAIEQLSYSTYSQKHLPKPFLTRGTPTHNSTTLLRLERLFFAVNYY
jgi:hypothetical protein